MKHQVVNVTEFKAKCLALLDGIEKSGGTITITKRGRIGKSRTVAPSGWPSSEGKLAGKLPISDDLLMADTSDLWEVVHQRKGVRI